MGPSDRAPKVLIVEDEPQVYRVCRKALEEVGCTVIGAGDGPGGLRLACEASVDVAVLDIHLPGFDGVELLRRIRIEKGLGFPVIMMTGYGTVDSAVAAMKLGAADYLQKPFTMEDLQQLVLEATRSGRPRYEDRPEWADRLGFIGNSRRMLEVFALIERVARSDVTVLIHGESGTGKEIAARAIHALSRRSSESFIPVDCSTLASSIVESELFGHVKGAFTGADSERDGLLRLAGSGTVFLDEIFELPFGVQSKLLRVLQERVVRPVGAEAYLPVEARILSASNRDLMEAVKAGDFREDLFYRIHVVPIYLPPLRERAEDIPVLVEHFIRKHRSDTTRAEGMSDEALDLLLAYEWPGNIRQLENAVQSALVLCDEPRIQPSNLPRNLRGEEHRVAGPGGAASAGGGLAEAEKAAILDALKRSGGNKRQAARILGIGPATLYRKLRKFGISFDS